jgi:hypothetical protein
VAVGRRPRRAERTAFAIDPLAPGLSRDSGCVRIRDFREASAVFTRILAQLIAHGAAQTRRDSPVYNFDYPRRAEVFALPTCRPF